MKALILAGGKGSRLRPFTTVIPKPLMPIAEVPILEIILRQLNRAGITEIILAVGYHHHLIEAYFGNGNKFGTKIQYSREDQPLGTAGPIAYNLENLGDDFLVMNGDILTSLDYHHFIQTHLTAKAAATIGTTIRENKIDYGVIEVNANSELHRYVEKPTHTYQVSMGINLFNRKAVAQNIERGEKLDIPALMTRLRAVGEKVLCIPTKCYWLDIGRIEDYEIAQQVFEEQRTSFIPPPLETHIA